MGSRQRTSIDKLYFYFYDDNMNIFSIKKQIHFCYGHRLLDYQGACKNLHGHNAIAEFEVESPELNSLGMVQDFTEVKKIMGSWIEKNLDHKMILHTNDPYVLILKNQNEPLYLLKENPTAENIAQLLFYIAQKKGLKISRVTLWETPASSASYSEK